MGREYLYSLVDTLASNGSEWSVKKLLDIVPITLRLFSYTDSITYTWYYEEEDLDAGRWSIVCQADATFGKVNACSTVILFPRYKCKHHES